MADRLALLIAVDTHQDSHLPSAAHAAGDAAALSRALEALGFARDHQVVLAGSQATKTAIDSRLRKLVKSPPKAETLFVFFAGHALQADGENYLACYDTQADDLVETSIPLHKVLDALAA